MSEERGDIMNKENFADKKFEMKNNHDNKKQIKPGDIKGKIEVKDTRERRDGPGGN